MKLLVGTISWVLLVQGKVTFSCTLKWVSYGSLDSFAYFVVVYTHDLQSRAYGV